jgi:hypothetical protein
MLLLVISISVYNYNFIGTSINKISALDELAVILIALVSQIPNPSRSFKAPIVKSLLNKA